MSPYRGRTMAGGCGPASKVSSSDASAATTGVPSGPGGAVIDRSAVSPDPTTVLRSACRTPETNLVAKYVTLSPAPRPAGALPFG